MPMQIDPSRDEKFKKEMHDAHVEEMAMNLKDDIISDVVQVGFLWLTFFLLKPDWREGNTNMFFIILTLLTLVMTATEIIQFLKLRKEKEKDE